MTDRELLELAAKAAGLRIASWADGRTMQLGPVAIISPIDGRTYGWRPLTDDGDALRLAVKLKLEISRHHCTCCIAVSDGVNVDLLERFESVDEPPTQIQDEYAATRRAIVRAAAAIGEAK